MGKVNVVPIDAVSKKRFEKVNRAIEDYYDVADMDELRDIGFDIFDSQKNLSQRKKTFAAHKKTVLALKPLFKRLVLERNKAVKKDGYRNYLEFAANYDRLPWEKFELFLERVDLAIKELNRKFPKVPSEAVDWYWTEYNTPDAPCLVTKKKYSVPDDILETIKKKAPQVATIIPKIEIRKLTDFHPNTWYDEKNKKVVIFVTSGKTSICGALSFLHEIGHAVVMLDCLEKGTNPMREGKYWNEERGYEMESKLIKKLFSKKIHEAWLASFLSSFSTSLFEHEIYSNPKQDFDKIYARIKNRCLLKANQHKNPFYVLHPYYINQPGNAALASVAITELLLEGKI